MTHAKSRFLIRSSIAWLWLAALASAGQAQNRIKTKITILEGDSIEPYAIRGETEKEPSGIQIDLFNAIFKDSPYKPGFLFVPLYRISTDVDRLKADGATRMFHFGTNNIQGFLSKVPYIKYKGCVVTLESAKQINSMSELSRLSIVGFQGGSISFQSEFSDAIKNNPHYREINNQQSQVALLHLNRVDAIVADIYISEAKERLFAQESRVTSKKFKCNIDLHSNDVAPI
jgi:polar amino acid transport system substrate-binding protein